jgi:hypothetical protein
MAHIRRDWYRHDPPMERRSGAPVALLPAARTPRPLGRRPRAVFPRPGAPTWQTIGAIVAGSVLGLALLGAVVYGTVVGGGETVAGQQTRRGGIDVAPTGAIPTPPPAPAQPGSSRPQADTRQPAPGTQPTAGGPAIDRALREAEQEGRLTPEQVAAISRAISGEPIFEDVRRLTEVDIERLADATGLPPEQLAPVLARLVATGRVVMPARPPQAVAGSRTPRPAAGGADRPEDAASDEAVAGATAARDQAGGSPPGWIVGGAPAADTQVGPPGK